MDESVNRPGPSRLSARYRMKRYIRRPIPLIVWGLVLIGTAALYIRQEVGISVTGYAEEIRYSIAPEATGRLQRLEVFLNQQVIRGQIVASFEDEELLLRLQEAGTELDRLAFELGRESALWELDAAGQQVDQQTNLRRFARDAENTHIEYLDALASLAEGRVELHGLELKLGRTLQLEENELASASLLDVDRIAYQAQSEWVEKQVSMTKIMRTTHREAEARYRKFLSEYVVETPDVDLLIKPLENAIKVQEIRIEQVNLAIVRLVLRAPADGRVVEIFRRAGEVVAAGQPVVSIIEPLSTQMVAYLPEPRILDYQPGAQVRFRRAADPGRVFDSWIAHMGSNVNPIPRRLGPGAADPGWGLAVFIPLPDSLEALPGEAFEVFF